MAELRPAADRVLTIADAGAAGAELSCLLTDAISLFTGATKQTMDCAQPARKDRC